MQFDDEDGVPLEPFEAGPSKSRLKRDSHALQDLGEELMRLSVDQLSRLSLPDELAEAVRVGRSIKAHGGLLRQRKFIGKLLRQIDAEPIRVRLRFMKGEGEESTRLLHQCERWRDRLLAGGEGVVAEFMVDHPAADRQRLRQLVREARREQELEKPPKAARLLFRHLRETLVEGVANAAQATGDSGD